MRPVGFKPTISADERPKTYALDRAAAGTGTQYYWADKIEKNEMIGACSTYGGEMFIQGFGVET